MSETGIKTFDKSLMKTKEWLKEIQDETGISDLNKSYMALRAVLHGIRDRLITNEAADLASQLPLILVGTFYENWSPSEKPMDLRGKNEFLNYVAGEMDPVLSQGTGIESMTRGIFKVIDNHVTEGEINDIKSGLPEDIRSLWP